MNTEPDDDLDATAELPQLDLKLAHSLYADGDEATDQDAASGALSDSAKTGAWPALDGAASNTEATANWQLFDELLTVRDKIVDLEAALLDAELRLAKLDKQHQDLQVRHAELGAHDAEVAKDRERIDAERALLQESRQQLKQQFETYQAEAVANALSLQQQIEQLRQQSEAQHTEQALRHEQQLAELTRHQETVQQLSTNLLSEQSRVQLLEANLQAASLAHTSQETAAATLARNLSHELLAKQTLQSELTLRAQRIYSLESLQQQLTKQLADTEARHVATQGTIDELRANLRAHVQQIAELQTNLGLVEQRAASVGEQLEVEHRNWRSAEQDKERLTRLASVEHESYESTRKELSARLAELSAVQEQLAHARAEAVALGAQVTDRDAQLRSRDDLLIAKEQAIRLAEDKRASSARHETALIEALSVVREELRQSQIALQERGQSLQSVEQQLAEQHEAKQQLLIAMETIEQQTQQQEAQLHKRDQFILEQATELEQVQHAEAELDAQLKRALVFNETQQARILALEAELLPLRTEREQQLLLLAKLQQELATKHQEQGASAKQVEALQHELHQHVEALNAIRRDIHQVAQQSRYRDSDVIVRTLVRADDASVVHLLNKAVMVIGRANDADICIHSEAISRRHACLRIGRDVAIIEDLGSTNGCYVNGKRVKRQLLKDGDKLDVAGVVFRFSTRVSQA